MKLLSHKIQIICLIWIAVFLLAEALLFILFNVTDAEMAFSKYRVSVLPGDHPEITSSIIKVITTLCIYFACVSKERVEDEMVQSLRLKIIGWIALGLITIVSLFHLSSSMCKDTAFYRTIENLYYLVTDFDLLFILYLVFLKSSLLIEGKK